ncbi:uncharacterized protein F5147DRAFT_746487 [Suillus discolor]|uniref:CxC1-like cysteine cluster associated with KDZ transposases domain-containing protein n=1 Tax=Suillus discolor TaxID=1912936 RepID=A0A9P7JS43_9AGAM|nr:uncharacterized protein F5147DRAFT_746487 [Suillus discolor]KAG2105063.1 hypothetical protein F5147DRAFT_746487 [Suillus discolor]
MGCAPLFPTVAISICTLANYCQCHRTCPRFSIQAQCKALCHLHDMPYRPYLNSQFSDTYDIYLEILNRVDRRLNGALHRNTPDWRLLNACPCCSYQLEDEPPLAFKWLASIDGNNSLKRWVSSTYGLTAREDSRKPHSDYWIDQMTVDAFKDEVRRSAQKKMFSVFDESGIFIAACQHRFILLACDMVRSGELAKYPLALMNQLLSVFGVNGGCAYDIGSNSSLGPLAQSLNLCMMVGAFHGHAHNRRCQLDWHPITRHASPFHRHQMIEEHFAFWDQDKYAALTLTGIFLRNHYKEALTLIHTLSAELSAIKQALNLTDADFARFHTEERSYLESLQEQPLSDQLQIRYIQVLDDLNERHQARIRVDTAYTKLQHAEAFTAHIESQLTIEERWTVGGDEYNKYKDEVLLQKYRVALDELERLVVMRLFELSKLSLSGMGYKLWQQIRKALQRRSDAIRNAINKYNVQATALNPPRPHLSWKDIANYSFLGEFDVLRYSRTDMCELDWAKPTHREGSPSATRTAIDDRRYRSLTSSIDDDRRETISGNCRLR